jgi:ABC-2 type transport system permease protein
MRTLTLAAKDLRLLLRDARSGVILLLMPLLFVAVLGMAVGEGFGQKPDDRLRISLVNLDAGLPPNSGSFPGRPWSEVVIDDLSGTADIRIELIPTREEAERLVRRGDRSAVLIFERDFSARMHRCSFVTFADPPLLASPQRDTVAMVVGGTPTLAINLSLNPLYRDGIDVAALGLTVRKDPTQAVASSIIEQVAQVTLMRVVIPWMIGKAFERVGDERFMEAMAEDVPLLKLAPPNIRKAIGPGVKKGIQRLFSNYDFYAKTWAGLTLSEERPAGGTVSTYTPQTGVGLLKRGALRYQILVPSYTVMFAFFLVLTVGWLFVAERRQGTLVRLRAAPLTRGQILIGKLLPCLLVSLFQGFFLLVAGKLVFGMSWGPQPLWLIPVVVCTSFAAMGLALLIAGLARTETQVAVYGTLLVLVLAGLSGSLMPRDLMPEEMRRFSYVTPHAWALDAYSQLLINPSPEIGIVIQACGALLAFGIGFLALAWWLARLD